MPKYAEQKRVPYSPEQMFDLVADVGKYPQFLPWCIGARIRSHEGNELVADLTIGFGPFRESFTSRVSLDAPSLIQVRYENGPFKYLRNEWRFSPDPRGTLIDFFVDFEFRSLLLQKAIGPVFGEAVRRMVAAFLRRARERYGAPQPAPVSLSAKA